MLREIAVLPGEGVGVHVRVCGCVFSHTNTSIWFALRCGALSFPSFWELVVPPVIASIGFVYSSNAEMKWNV